MAGPQDYAATAAAVAAANKKTTASTTKPTPTKATPVKTVPSAPKTGALPASFKPYLGMTDASASVTVAYPTAEIWDAQYNEMATVFTSGPNAGKTADGRLVIQGTKPAGVTGGGNGSGATTPAATNARSLLESILNQIGIPSDMMSSSISYFESLNEAGITDPQQLIDIYMNNKTFTTKSGTVLNSPFYARYTSLGAGLMNPATGQPYSAKETFAFRLGMEDVTKRYGLSSQFVSEENLKKFISNNVSPDVFETRAQQAELASAVADPNKVAALQKLGYITGSQGLKDFYLNPDIGQKQLEENQRIGAYATEALRYASKGIGFDAKRFAQISAMYGNVTEMQAAQNAAKLYGGVAENLNQTIALSGIYDKTGLTAAQEATGIQTELENELLPQGVASDRRQRLAETNIRAFQGKAGVGQGALSTKPTAGLI